MKNWEELRLGYYEDRILTEFVVDQIRINFKKIGNIQFEKSFPVDLNNFKLIDEQELETEIVEVIDFMYKKAKEEGRFIPRLSPVWLRTNIMDNAMNSHVGIGFINFESQWLKLVLCSLSVDRAEQSGDTLFTIFDKDFNWAVNFELDQDYSRLIVQKFEK